MQGPLGAREGSSDSSQTEISMTRGDSIQKKLVGDDVEGSVPCSGCARMFEYSIMDALAAKDGDAQSMMDLKEQVCGLHFMFIVKIRAVHICCDERLIEVLHLCCKASRATALCANNTIASLECIGSSAHTSCLWIHTESY
jgi:hypothetical protein